MRTSEYHKKDDSILPDHEIDHWFKVLAAIGNKSNEEILGEYSDLSIYGRNLKNHILTFLNLRSPFPCKIVQNFTRDRYIRKEN